jgi:hypothetical protein
MTDAPLLVAMAFVGGLIGGVVVEVVDHLWPSAPQPIVIQMPGRAP